MATFDRGARAAWQGGGKEGKGQLTTDSGVLKATSYSATSRFGDQSGTNPEELIAAAHAGCFAMALAFGLEQAGFAPDTLDVQATVTVQSADPGFKITKSALVLKASVPGISADKFKELADGAKENCPVSKVLNAQVTLDASLA